MVERIAGLAGQANRCLLFLCGWHVKHTELLRWLFFECFGIQFRMEQAYQLQQTFPCLLNSPVIAKPDYEGSHFSMRPAKREIMSVESIGNHFSRGHPDRHSRIIIKQFIQRQGQIGKGRLLDLSKAGLGLFFSEQFPEDFHTGAMTVELTGGENIFPIVHPIP